MSQHLMLVVDDDPKIRAFIKEVFPSEEFMILEGATGLEALAHTQDLIPDLILLDIHMPRMDGLHACSKLRERPHLNRVPIIMFTVDRDAQSVSAAFAAGADDYVAKPFSLTTLEEKVHHWLSAKPDHSPHQPMNGKVGTQTA